jgi:hypothetical protein
MNPLLEIIDQGGVIMIPLIILSVLLYERCLNLLLTLFKPAAVFLPKHRPASSKSGPSRNTSRRRTHNSACSLARSFLPHRSSGCSEPSWAW